MFENRILPDGASLLIEILGRPTVYLDNWALYEIAATPALSSNFVSAMRYHAGTLRISTPNIVELLKLTDGTQIDQILHVIDAVDAGFIDVNFVDVIQRENQLLAGAGDHQNPSQALTFIRDYLLALNWPEVWSVSDVVRHMLANGDNLAFVQSYDSFADTMEKFLEACRADPEYMKKSCNRARSARQADPEYCAATRELVTRSLDFILQNKGMNMPGKEWHDLYHTIVPVAYCDIVLLDGRWANFVSQSGLHPSQIASVFTKRSLSEGIDAITRWERFVKLQSVGMSH